MNPSDSDSELQLLPVAKIRESTYLMRSTFKNIEKLAASIQTHGLIHPPLVMPIDDPAYDYEIVVGNRRLRALRHLGEEVAPFIVLKEQLSAFDALLYTGIENIQREYVDRITLGRWVLSLLEIDNPATGERFTLQTIANRVGEDEKTLRSWVEAARTAINLEEAIKEQAAAKEESDI